uniref:Uncharacterized protein n=1 Tax=Anguilla anguilla TaxID=7936 RepID=A0A0E9XE62_ANGAN
MLICFPQSFSTVTVTLYMLVFVKKERNQTICTNIND